MLRSLFLLLYLIPKNHLSWLVGKIVHLKLPRPLSTWSIKIFIWYFGIETSSAKKSVDEFSSIGEFFVRRLKEGARPVGQGVVSPVDGRVLACGAIDGETMLQVKGKSFSIRKLLADDELAREFADGYFLTIYLSPPDYHCIHSPVSGSVSRAIHVPGKLWPVNAWGVNSIDDLFAVNERVTSIVDSQAGKVAVIMVGATSVGSIALNYDELVSNQSPSFFTQPSIDDRSYNPPMPVAKADMLGQFQMGSTVILLFQKDRFSPNDKCSPETVLLLGESLTN